MDPDEFADADKVPGEELSPGEKFKLLFWVSKEHEFQLGKSQCQVQHLKKRCHNGKIPTINKLIQAYYKEFYPDFCQKWVR